MNACKVKFHCQRCGKELPDEPHYQAEHSDDGKERVCRTVPACCPKCRSDGFWRRWKEEEKDG